MVGLMRIGLVCGSLGVRSANAAMLQVAAARLEASGHETSKIDQLFEVPPFDPAAVDDPPSAVRQFRDQIRACDAILIAAPEYAAGVAGSTKNALDWLVGDSTMYRTVIGVASAGTTGGSYAIEQLVRTISWQGGWPVASLGIAAPRTKSDDDGNFTDPPTLAAIEIWADTVVEAFDADGTRRGELLAAVVIPYGIDPERFGDLDSWHGTN